MFANDKLSREKKCYSRCYKMENVAESTALQNLNERYINFLSYNQHVIVIARTGPHNELKTVMRVCDMNLTSCTVARTIFNRELRFQEIAHNAAPLLRANSISIIGGIIPPLYHGPRSGVYLIQSPFIYPYSTFSWRITKLFDRTTVKRYNCIERRNYCAGVCEFDGKFSIVRFRGRFMLYARANLQVNVAERDRQKIIFGGRHVQVATSQNLEGPWSNFSIVTIKRYVLKREHNIYFASVKTNPLNTKTLVGMFPTNDNAHNSSVIVALSCDGIHFSSPYKLVVSRFAHNYRGDVHPVDGLTLNKTHLHFYVQYNVPGIAHSPSRVARHAVTRENMKLWTLSALRELEECSDTQYMEA